MNSKINIVKEGNIVKKVIPISVIAVLSATAIFLGVAFISGNKSGGSTDTVQSDSEGNNVSADNESGDNNSNVSAGTAQISDFLTLKDKDTTAEYNDSEAVHISLNGTSIEGDGQGYSIDGSSLTINNAGIYVLEGTLENGSIIVNVPDTDDVRLIFNGASINSTTTAPINIVQADKVIVTLVDGTDNSITDSRASTDSDNSEEDIPDAAIYSKEDLSFNGNGSLTVKAEYKDGIVGKDDVIIAGGNFTITASNNGLKGKDSVNVTAGTLNITSGNDGIKTTNSEEASKGYIHITGGTFNIISDGDGIQGQNTILVEDGTINITAGGGSKNAAAHTDDRGGFKDFNNTTSSTASDSSEDSTSTKGIKTVTDLLLNGGTITVDSADDTVHSNDNVIIDGSTLLLTAGDDGIHGDSTATISSGTITIKTSYEGIESAAIVVKDGIVNVISTDDGFNATSGTSTGGMGGMDQSDGSTLNISGGQIYVNAAGDGLDSNGDIIMSGGTVVVNGPENSGNGALDYAGSFEITGGQLIAAGASGMAQSVSNASNVGAVSITMDSSQTANTQFNLTDEQGNVIISTTPAKTWQTIVIASSDIKTGETYKYSTGGSLSGATDQGNGLYTGGTVSSCTEVGSYTQDSAISSVGTGNTMGGGGFGGNKGNRPDDNQVNGGFPDGNKGNGQMPDGGPGQMPDGAPDQMPDRNSSDM